MFGCLTKTQKRLLRGLEIKEIRDRAHSNNNSLDRQCMDYFFQHPPYFGDNEDIKKNLAEDKETLEKAKAIFKRRMTHVHEDVRMFVKGTGGCGD